MERERRNTAETIFEDNGGEAAVIGADDTGMVQQQRLVVESEIAPADGEGAEDEQA